MRKWVGEFFTSYATGLRREGLTRAEAFVEGTCCCDVGVNYFKAGILKGAVVTESATFSTMCTFGIQCYGLLVQIVGQKETLVSYVQDAVAYHRMRPGTFAGALRLVEATDFLVLLGVQINH